MYKTDSSISDYLVVAIVKEEFRVGINFCSFETSDSVNDTHSSVLIPPKQQEQPTVFCVLSR